MTISETNDNDRFAHLLAELEADLTAGVPLDTSLFSSLADASLCERLLKAAQCLEYLELAWPRPKAAEIELQPTAIDRFEIIEELGRGGFGVVYRAFDPALDRYVALKVQRPETVLSAEMRRRFLREAKAAGSLNHPHIVTVHDVGEASLLAWIAVEYCPGLSLAEWLARYRTPARPRLAAECVANLASAVAYAHSCGIWHRDIKPSNVLLALSKSEAPIAEASDSAIGSPACSDVKGIQSKSDIGAIKDRGVEKLSNARIKLADFGLAKLLDENTQNTASGTLLGTPAYMAPEQIESSEHQVGPATDVYGLGLLLYELLTARTAFTGDTRAEVFQQVLLHEPQRPRRISRKIPRDLEAIVLQAINKEPRRRYSSAAEMAVDLHRWLDGKPIGARQPNVLGHAWRWLRRRPAVAAVLMLAIAATVLFVMNRRIARENHALLGLMPAHLTTTPPGARVVLVPLDEVTGEPIPERAVRPTERTPLDVELRPADYFVVAVLDKKHFHEVYRRIPKDSRQLPGTHPHNRWITRNGKIELPTIEIPATEITDEMALIESTTDKAGPNAIPNFYMDCHEFTVADVRRRYPSISFRGVWHHEVPSNHAFTCGFEVAMNEAEDEGKRLATVQEYRMSAKHRTSGAKAFLLNANQADDFGPAGSPSEDCTDTDHPVFGLFSNVAEWTVSCVGSVRVGEQNLSPSDSFQSPLDMRIVFGGDWEVISGNTTVAREHREGAVTTAANRHAAAEPGLGFRCVRSAQPHYIDENE